MIGPRICLAIAFLFLTISNTCAGDDEPTGPIKDLADMTKSGTAFIKENYKTVRGHCSKLFESRYKKQIESSFGPDYEELSAWLEKNKEIKEELYSAIDEENDKIGAVLQIFHDLWKKNPEATAKYSNLAIAFAVVWDDPRAVYNYVQHQKRTKSTLPTEAGKTGPDVYFQDMIDRQKELQNREPLNRLQSLPWEFLIYVVDHRTPIDERKWASKNYLAKRPLIGNIYSEVPYDHEMLRTRSQTCKLTGKEYTLESVLKNGGVCAMQADFAARVGKSLLVPAAYIWGESQFKELHAWVMWVEVHSAGAQINFTVESHGRYLLDNFYTGQLVDPQTGKVILDRDMERRLAAVGRDRVGKRQAELLMAHFDEICKIRGLDKNRKVAFLDRCLALSPYNESAWIELARQVRQGELEKDMKQVVLTHIESILKTLAKYPDFSWKIANDLIQIQDDKLSKIQFYTRLVAIYEQADRPDLACEARLKWAELQADDSKWQLVARGLAYTIQKFPSEGRYVPKLVTRLKEVCGKFKGGNDYLGTQYQELLKKVPSKRGSDPSVFCIQMYKQAIEFFKENKKDKIAKDLESRLSLVESGQLPTD